MCGVPSAKNISRNIEEPFTKAFITLCVLLVALANQFVLGALKMDLLPKSSPCFKEKIDGMRIGTSKYLIMVKKDKVYFRQNFLHWA